MVWASELALRSLKIEASGSLKDLVLGYDVDNGVQMGAVMIMGANLPQV